MLDISLNNADNYGGRHENYLCRGRKLLMQGGRWAVKRRGRCKRSTTVEKWMCRLRRNELYRLKFRKKFVKNAKRKSTRACEYVSRRLQTTLYICRRREIYVLWLRTAEKRSVASRVHLPVKHFAQLRALFSSFFPLFFLSFCKLTRFSGAFFRLFPRCLIRGQAMIHFCTSS